MARVFNTPLDEILFLIKRHSILTGTSRNIPKPVLERVMLGEPAHSVIYELDSDGDTGSHLLQAPTLQAVDKCYQPEVRLAYFLALNISVAAVRLDISSPI